MCKRKRSRRDDKQSGWDATSSEEEQIWANNSEVNDDLHDSDRLSEEEDKANENPTNCKGSTIITWMVYLLFIWQVHESKVMLY